MKRNRPASRGQGRARVHHHLEGTGTPASTLRPAAGGLPVRGLPGGTRTWAPARPAASSVLDAAESA